MNVNREHKILWWAPERCGTKALANIFSKLGFEFYPAIELYGKNVKGLYQSHNIDILDEFSDYKIIFSTRNPYDRVLSLFSNFTNVGKNTLFTKDGQSNFIHKYEIFLKELFDVTDKEQKKPVLNNYILKYSFETKVPDMIVRIPYTFNSVYTRLGAKLVYEHHIKHFILSGYDPFSFTTELLSNKEKMDFIHDNLQ
jgi:hypothetical protein